MKKLSIKVFLIIFFPLISNAGIIYLDCKGTTETSRTVRAHTGNADKKDFKVYDEIVNYQELPIKSESFLYSLDETQNVLINISNNPINKYLNRFKKLKEKDCVIEVNSIVCDRDKEVTHEDPSSLRSFSSYMEISRISGEIKKREISLTHNKIKDENEISQSDFSGICKKIDKKAF